MKAKIFSFPPSLAFDQVVALAKKYCGDNNLRFIWIEPTVTLMPLVEKEKEKPKDESVLRRSS